MTVGTCAWMEKEWMQTIAPQDKRFFRGARYMDDILLVYATNPGWNHEKFVRDFTKSECYHPPLKLEDAKPRTFLETTFESRNARFEYWLKNENKGEAVPTVWRYQHFNSGAAFIQKRAVLMASLQKVRKMASDSAVMHQSAIQKLREFRMLGYPVSVLRGVCTYMAAVTHEYQWIKIRAEVTEWAPPSTV